MKNIFFCLFVLLSTALISQNEYNYYYDSEYIVDYFPLKYFPAQNVKKMIINCENVKNKKISVYSKVFNEKGKLINYNKIDEKNVEIPIIAFQYDLNNNKTSAKSYRKGKLKSETTFVYNEKNYCLEVKKKNKNNKILLHNTWEYAASGCLAQSITYINGTDKPKHKWVYEYFDKCKNSKTILYNKNGKVENTWTYDCSQEGTKLEKKKDETQVCKYEKIDDNFMIKVYQSFNEKGKLRKYVTKYTLKDTLIVESATYNEKDELLHLSTYDNCYDRPLIYTGYHNGKKNI